LSTSIVAAVVAAVALVSGAGAIDGGRGDADTAPSGRTSVSSTHDHVVRPMTTVWRPR